LRPNVVCFGVHDAAESLYTSASPAFCLPTLVVNLRRQRMYQLTQERAQPYTDRLMDTHFNPPALERIRAEHNSIFGTDLSQVELIISKAWTSSTSYLTPSPSSKRRCASCPPPSPPNKKPQTSHSPKTISDTQAETGSSASSPNFSTVTSSAGPKPGTFLLARLLVPTDHPFYPIKGAYRPFVLAPLTRIGQELPVPDTNFVLTMRISRSHHRF
jgi:hypothetical protein